MSGPALTVKVVGVWLVILLSPCILGVALMALPRLRVVERAQAVYVGLLAPLIAVRLHGRP